MTVAYKYINVWLPTDDDDKKMQQKKIHVLKSIFSAYSLSQKSNISVLMQIIVYQIWSNEESNVHVKPHTSQCM